MSKNNLDKRIANYEKTISGGSSMGRRIKGVDPRAFHKPGSNKK